MAAAGSSAVKADGMQQTGEIDSIEDMAKKASEILGMDIEIE